MPTQERKRSADTLPTPPTGSVINFTDESGQPSQKDENDVTTPSATIDGSPISLDNTTVPATPGSAVTPGAVVSGSQSPSMLQV